jgi:hypothetical protein
MPLPALIVLGKLLFAFVGTAATINEAAQAVKPGSGWAKAVAPGAAAERRKPKEPTDSEGFPLSYSASLPEKVVFND